MELELKEITPYLPYGVKFKGKRKDWNSFDNEIMTLCLVDLDGRWDIIKPILRPISDLLKEIEIGGRKFIPQYEIDKVWRDTDYLKSGNLRYAPFWVFEQLMMWHFDFFGLIEKGLAISINDVL